MTRTPSWLFRQAKRHSPNAANLLLATRSLPSALNELRWIREHVDRTTAAHLRPVRLAELCRRRGQGFPLQYVLGSQPFGPLDISCKPGVLIPRPETEAYTYHLANIIKTSYRGKAESPRIVDFCTGTGCIPLLLYALLQRSLPGLYAQGVDIAPQAISLAEANLRRNTESGLLDVPHANRGIGFLRGDLFCDNEMRNVLAQRWDIMTSNPPYISKNVWNRGCGQLGYSVRKFEPSLALVPPSDVHVAPGWEHPDAFYARLLDMAAKIQPKVLLVEVGDEAQAIRVASQYLKHPSAHISNIELWRDWPDLVSAEDETQLINIGEDAALQSVAVKGTGNVRCVVLQFPQPLSH